MYLRPLGFSRSDTTAAHYVQHWYSTHLDGSVPYSNLIKEYIIILLSNKRKLEFVRVSLAGRSLQYCREDGE